MFPTLATEFQRKTLEIGRSATAAFERSTLEQWLLFTIPVLACLGSALPIVPFVGSIFAFRVVVLIFFLVVLFRSRLARPSSNLASLVRLIALVWVTVALILFIIHGSSRHSWSEGISLIIGIMLLLSISAIDSPRLALRTALNGFLFAYSVISAIGLNETLFGVRFFNYFRTKADLSYVDQLGSASVFTNPSLYAFFLVFSLPILALGATSAVSRRLRNTYYIALFSTPFFMLATDSRLGLGLLLILATAFGLLFVKFRFVVISAALLLPAVASLPSLLAITQATIAKVADSVTQIYLVWVLNGVIPDTSIMARVNLTKNGIDFIADSFLMGWGPGSFESRMELGQGIYPTQGVINPHNGLIEIFSQYGVLVFALFVVFLFSLFMIGFKRVVRKPNSTQARVAGLTLVSLVGIFPFLALMNSSFLEPSISWLLLMFLLFIGISLEGVRPVAVPAERTTETDLV